MERARQRAYGNANSPILGTMLAGGYCCSDCLLDAWERGYPAVKAGDN